MDSLFISSTITKSVTIHPKHIDKNLDLTILKKIKEEIEGKCIKNGYVKPGSIKILKKNLGDIQMGYFKGHIVYNVLISLDLCNPLENAVIEAQVINTNKMGVLAGVPNEQVSPLNILLARQHHVDNENFANLKENDIINVKIVGKRYEFGDSQISIIGVLDTEN